MFRRLLRIKNKMSEEDTLKLLKEADDGVLGTYGEDGYPYTVVLNYVYLNNKIYFHSSKIGHKVDNIKYHENVSFTVYDKAEIVADKFTTKYKSVTVFGKAKIVEDKNIEVLNEFINKYSKGFIKEGYEYVQKSFSSSLIIELNIEHVCGKERT